MSQTLGGMIIGILLWAALAPSHWQVTLQDWADDAFQLAKAWAVIGWKKLEPRIITLADWLRQGLGPRR